MESADNSRLSWNWGHWILLTLMINLGIRTALNPSITYWHAEMAILMVIGTMIHIHITGNHLKTCSEYCLELKVI